MMWDAALSVSLVIFLTCTMFFVIYGMAYLVIYGTVSGAQRVIKKMKEPDDYAKRERKERF